MNDYLPKPFTPDDLYKKIFTELDTRSKRNGVVRKELPGRKVTFDLSYLRSISDNNEQFLSEMVQTFVQSIPPVLDEMDDCLRQKNWYRLSRLAHQIKPSFGLMGMGDLRKTVFYIEQNADQKTNLTELSEVTSHFIRDCKGVVSALAREMPSL